jgi:hypothetical protein
VKILASDSDLPQVIQALSPSRCGSNGLNRGKQHPDEEANDGNHHQQLDQRESDSFCHCCNLGTGY